MPAPGISARDMRLRLLNARDVGAPRPLTAHHSHTRLTHGNKSLPPTPPRARDPTRSHHACWRARVPVVSCLRLGIDGEDTELP